MAGGAEAIEDGIAFGLGGLCGGGEARQDEDSEGQVAR
jgi:hypothetical protein